MAAADGASRAGVPARRRALGSRYRPVMRRARCAVPAAGIPAAVMNDGRTGDPGTAGAGRGEAGWRERLVAWAHLQVPPYQLEPGRPVREVLAGGGVARIAQARLAGPLRELVTAVLAQGGDDG
jgi:hypothetical protein